MDAAAILRIEAYLVCHAGGYGCTKLFFTVVKTPFSVDTSFSETHLRLSHGFGTPTVKKSVKLAYLFHVAKCNAKYNEEKESLSKLRETE